MNYVVQEFYLLSFHLFKLSQWLVVTFSLALCGF